MLHSLSLPSTPLPHTHLPEKKTLLAKKFISFCFKLVDKHTFMLSFVFSFYWYV